MDRLEILKSLIGSFLINWKQKTRKIKTYVPLGPLFIKPPLTAPFVKKKAPWNLGLHPYTLADSALAM